MSIQLSYYVAAVVPMITVVFFFFHFTLHKSLISRQLPYYVAAVSLKWFFVTIVIFVPNDDMVVINQIEIRKYLTNFSYYESLVNLTVQQLK